MRGPIDYIVVEFKNKKFDGSILNSLKEPLEKGVIALVSLAAINKDKQGVVTVVDVSEMEDQTISTFVGQFKPELNTVDKDDVDEISESIDNDVTVGLLVVEQLWAKPLKGALIKSNAVLLAEGRIHPDAEKELDSK